MNPWKNYSQERPQTAGVYQWRVTSKAVAGLVLIFLAHMRVRGAGLTTMLSPTFDYWDGYNVHVPKDTQWREVENPPKIRECDAAQLEAEGTTHIVCPFCNKTPALHGNQSGYPGGGGGVVIASDVHKYNTFWLVCCSYGGSPCDTDPRKIAEFRNNALEAFAKNHS